MPRREEIIAAVEGYIQAHPPLPRASGRLLAIMFADGDVCRRSQRELAEEGFNRKQLPRMLRGLLAAGFISKRPGAARVPDAYRLHLPPVQR